MALDPLQVKSDGVLVFKEELLNNPRSLCSVFSDHNERLINLVDSQPRSKKSRRCVLHSWDLQKSRPVTPAWKDVWAVMHEKCKAEVLLIDFSMLLSKLENFLKKHRYESAFEIKYFTINPKLLCRGLYHAGQMMNVI